jgi:hypothetical protein
MFLVYTPFEMFLLETAIKHPQAPQKMIIVAIAKIIIFRGAKRRCCGNRTATINAKGERRNEAKRSRYERETAGEKYKPAFGVP